MDAPSTVGYGKPPKESQFKKGKSGNPRGRPKNRLADFQRSFIAELKSPMTIVEDGKKKRVSKLEAFMKSLVARGIKGESTATRLVLHFSQNLPQNAFLDNDTIVHYTSKKKLEEFIQLIEEAAKDYM
jgi:hypothetical protein